MGPLTISFLIGDRIKVRINLLTKLLEIIGKRKVREIYPSTANFKFPISSGVSLIPHSSGVSLINGISHTITTFEIPKILYLG